MLRVRKYRRAARVEGERSGEEGGGGREVRRREVRRRCQARVEHRALRARRWRVEGWGEEGDPFTSKGVHARVMRYSVRLLLSGNAAKFPSGPGLGSNPDPDPRTLALEPTGQCLERLHLGRISLSVPLHSWDRVVYVHTC